MKHVGIILAAGSGKRMGGDVPKQYLEIKGKPIIYYTIKAFEDSFIDEIILVTRREDITYCENEIVKKYNFKKVTKVIEGGKERYDSVYCGIKAVADEDCYVYIQDGARPFVSEEILLRAKADVEEYGAIVVAVPSKDTIKIADENENIESSPSRNTVWNAQTPQAFVKKEILSAFEKLMKAKENGEQVEVTDDGQVLLLFSELKVHLTMGDYSNIKVTTTEDILVAEKFLEKISK